MKLRPLIVSLAVVLAACTSDGSGIVESGLAGNEDPADEAVGNDSGPKVVPEPTTEVERPPEYPMPEGEPFRRTVDEFCGNTGDSRIEMVFVATILAVDNSEAQPWTAFEVSEWFTDDIGTTVGLWSSGFEGEVGEKWLITSSRYNSITGDVYWCASEPFTEARYIDWVEEFGDPVVAGAAVAETPATPEMIEALVANRALWNENKPTSYTYTIQAYVHSGVETSEERCGRFQMRVVVEHGQVTQARGIGQDCDVDPEDVVRIEDTFAMVEQGGGSVEGPASYSPQLGFVRSFYAWDRSIEVSVYVSQFEVGAFPLSDSHSAELEAARALWAKNGPTNYRWSVDTACFCGVVGEVEYEVFNGDPIRLTDAVAGDQRTIDTVEELFDVVAGAAEYDSMQVAYHPEFGYPTEVRIDQWINAVDDEVDYFARGLVAID